MAQLESVFSNQASADHPNFAPAAPIINAVTFDGRVAKVGVTLPTTDSDGGALTGLTDCNVFYKTTSFEGSTPDAERAAGTAIVTVPVTVDQAGTAIVVEIPGLSFGETFYFVATCRD